MTPKPSPRAAVLGHDAPAAPTAPAAPASTEAAPVAAAAPAAKKARKPRKIDPATGKPVVVSPEERRARALARWAKDQRLVSVVEFLPAEMRETIAKVAFVALRGQKAAAALRARADKVEKDAAEATASLAGFVTRLAAVRAQVEEASRAALVKAAGLAEPTPSSDGAAL